MVLLDEEHLCLFPPSSCNSSLLFFHVSPGDLPLPILLTAKTSSRFPWSWIAFLHLCTNLPLRLPSFTFLLCSFDWSYICVCACSCGVCSFHHSSEIGQISCRITRKRVAAAASGQRERVDQKITTALPWLARVSPMASTTKSSTVSTTGTAEEIGQQTGLRERVEQGIKTAHLHALTSLTDGICVKVFHGFHTGIAEQRG